MDTVSNPPYQRRKLSVDDYYRMAEVGILAPEDRVELIEGEIIEMVPKGSNHSGTVSLLAQRIATAVKASAIVSTQNPVRLGRFDEPEPDIAVLQPREDFYRDNHPTGADTLLIIEVADSSLRYDRDVKVPLYARAGVPEVWIVNLKNRCLLVYRRPVGDGYADVQTMIPQRLAPLALPDCEIDLRELFPMQVRDESATTE